MRLGPVAGVAATVVVVVALWSVARLGQRERAPSPAPATPAPADTAGGPGDEIVDEALSQIPDADSTALKSRWMDDIAGIDLAGLEGGRLEVFLRHVNARRCTCGCGYTLATCRTYDPTCPVSGGIVEALRDSVLDGGIRDAQGLRERPRSAAGSPSG